MKQILGGNRMYLTMDHRRAYRAILLAALVVASNCILGQQVNVKANVRAGSGWNAQYEMHVDPDNSKNMMLCGFKFNAKDDALYGYVYFSSDQGKNWHLVLEPRNSTFESEESCAYGVRGIAYYVTSSSKVIDGDPHHEQGTTRIYISADSGKTWRVGAKTGWNDWSTSVVDTAPGPNQNRLYAFFNANEFYPSLGQPETGQAQIRRGATTGSWMAMISYTYGDSQVDGPVFVTAPAVENYTRGGSFPAAAFQLKDGAILALNTTKRRTERNIRETLVEAIRTTLDRKGLEAPIKVVSSVDNPADDNSTGVTCGSYFLDSAATYDPVHDKVYFAFGQVSDKKCELMLTSSADGGKSWTKAHVVRTSDADGDQEYVDPAVAINKDGIMALMWQKSYRSGCWMFATSIDDGKSLSRATPLGTCNSSEMKPSRLDTAYLWDSFFQADTRTPDASARINLRNSRNNQLGKNQDAIAVTRDGVFHPVWSDAGAGDGELRTAAIDVIPAPTLISNATRGLTPVTSKVAILYGGDQFYDPKTKLITLDVLIKNNSDHPLTGPFKLAVPNSNDGEFTEIANADNQVPGGGAVWDISSSVPNGTLAAGASSHPFALKFRYLADEDKPRSSDDILGLSLRVYAAK